MALAYIKRTLNPTVKIRKGDLMMARQFSKAGEGIEIR
jgi:hypothetical protein